jgi:hypothetical protein
MAGIFCSDSTFLDQKVLPLTLSLSIFRRLPAITVFPDFAAVLSHGAALSPRRPSGIVGDNGGGRLFLQRIARTVEDNYYISSRDFGHRCLTNISRRHLGLSESRASSHVARKISAFLRPTINTNVEESCRG